MAWGALAGAAPDLDVLFSVAGDGFDQLQMHRGITHSVFFAPVVGPLWGWLLDRRERARLHRTPDPGRLFAWMGAITLALASHPWLDYFTPYGTQLLLPFSDTRFALPVMPIIDPAYTALLCGGLIAAALLRRRAAAGWASLAGIVVSSAYIGWAAHLNDEARRFAERDLRAAGIEDATVYAYPTVLQIHYRRLVARSPDVDRVGYVSLWDPCPIDWGSAPRIDAPALEALRATREGAIFEWFAMGMTHAVLSADAGGGVTASLVDLRYGADTDPTHSIFGVAARVDAAGALLATPALTTYRPSPQDAERIGRLLAAYAACVVPDTR
jgi:inner membrane protein